LLAMNDKASVSPSHTDRKVETNAYEAPSAFPMQVVVGSENPVKVEAVKEALMLLGIDAEVRAAQVKSGVPNQPICGQALEGAKNRAGEALALEGTDIGVGIEGGICPYAGRTLAFAAVFAKGKDGAENFSFSASFTLPDQLVQLMNQGKELGDAVDQAFGTREAKRGVGAVGLLTGVLSRKELYVQPSLLALYVFRKPS